MKWVKHNPIVIVCICVFVVLSTAGGWFVQNAMRKLGGVEDSLREKHDQLEQMRGSKPYPSEENVALLQKDRQRITEQYEALCAAVGKSEVSLPDKLDPFFFQQSLYQKWGQLQQSAMNAGVKLPDKFTFGFSRYLDSAPCTDAKGDDCTRRLRLLMKQLLAVEKITDLLISNNVEDIRSVRCAEVEPKPGLDTLGPVADREPSSLYETLPFEFQFGCSTTSLREVLNGLSHSDSLFVIRSLTASTEMAEISAPTSSAANPLFVSSSERSLAAASSQATTGRRRLVVTIRLDLAEFPQSRRGK